MMNSMEGIVLSCTQDESWVQDVQDESCTQA